MPMIESRAGAQAMCADIAVWGYDTVEAERFPFLVARALCRLPMNCSTRPNFRRLREGEITNRQGFSVAFSNLAANVTNARNKSI